MSGVQIPPEARNISNFEKVQTDSGTHPASYLMGIKVLFLG
jgi:hypothetical protein